MFARPKPAPTGKGTSSAPPKSSTRHHTATARSGSTASTSSPSKPPVSRIRAATAASLARAKSVESAAPTIKRSTPVKKKAALDPKATESELEWSRAEGAYADYARAELLRIRARDEQRRVKEAAERDVAMLWTANSRELKALQEARIGLDKHEYLTDLLSKGQEDNLKMKRLAESLPDAADRLCALANRLSAAQDYLKIEGGATAGKWQREKIANTVKEAAEAFEEHKVSDDELVSEKSVSDALSGVRHASSSIASCQKECGRLLDLVSDEEVREASLELDRKRRGDEGREDMLELEMPEAVPLPKLVDI